MDPNTNTVYLIAGALSICLSLVLVVVARLQSGNGLMRRSVLAILLLSAGLLVSGYGPVLPRWATVVLANLILLSAGAVICSGFADYCELHPGRPEYFGWAVVALTVLPFWYWGLIDSVGNYRSAVFSFALAAILARTCFMLTRKGWQYARRQASLVMAFLFGLVAAGMAARGVLALVVPAPPALRSVNPTEWPTVAAYMLLMSVLALCVMWIGLGQTQPERRDTLNRAKAAFTLVGYFRNRLLLLWAMVLVLVLAIISEAGLFYTKSFQWEKERLSQAVELHNDLMVGHSSQVMAQVDTLLHSVRSFYLRTHSVADTEGFINSLPFDKSVIENVYLINAQGRVVITHDPLQSSVDAADRYYFRHHQANPADQILIGPVDSGRVTHELYFRVTRRISNSDGSFAGVVLGTVKPQAFARYYQEHIGGSQNAIALIGTFDKKLRARAPEPPADSWSIPVESVLWDALQLAPSGSYENSSPIDNVSRIFFYKKVGNLPLVMVSGFSKTDIQGGVNDRIRWMLVGTVTAVVIILLLASALTIQIQQRSEQENFFSMLSHELKTPLAVIRMALSQNQISERSRTHAQQSVLDMDTIVHRCLQVDRLQQSGHAAIRQGVQIRELLDNLQTASATPQRLQITVPDLPTFSTDPQLLSIALNNLIENALKYSPAVSTVQISASCQTHKRRPGILLRVSNAVGGAGMPDSRQVFHKYYRGARAHNVTGSGLGLYLVHSVVRLLGGWVRYAPSQDRVCFEIWLPT